MGLNFRKSINLTKNVRLNLSKNSVSLSLGTKGARFTIGPKGTRTTLSIPNTGIYYTKTHSYKDLKGDSKKKDNKSESTYKEEDYNNYTNYIENLTQLHRYCHSPIDWKKIADSEVEYDSESEILAEKKYDSVKPSVFESEDDPLFLEKKEKAYQDFLAIKNQNKEEYQQKLELKNMASEILSGSDVSYFQAINDCEVFEDLQPYFKDLDFDLETSNCMNVDVITIANELITKDKLVKKNGKIVKTTCSDNELYKIYDDYISSLAIRIARELFALLPLDTVIVNCLEEDRVIMSVALEKNKLEKTNFDNDIDASDELQKYPNNKKLTKTGFETVEKLHYSDLFTTINNVF